MIIFGNKIKTYKEFDKYFHYLKCLTCSEVLESITEIEKFIEAPESAKEYAHRCIAEEVRKWNKDFIEDSILIIFMFAVYLNKYLKEANNN